MKIKEIISLNRWAAGHLRKASPYYMLVNLAEAAVNSASTVLQIIFYQKIIDFVIYQNERLWEIAVRFLFYFLFRAAVWNYSGWVMRKFNEQEKVRINQYYKKMAYAQTAKKGLCNYNSDKYQDMLYNAVYNEGDCLFSFVSYDCSLLYALISFTSLACLFGQMHVIFIISAVVSAVKNCICTDRKNKINYRIHTEDLAFDRADRYIYDLFYKKQYVREFKLYPVGDFFIRKYKLLKKLRYQKNRKQNAKKSLVDFASAVVDLALYVVHVVFLVYLLTKQEITVGEFSLVLSNFSLLADGMERILMFWPMIRDNMAYVRDIFGILHGKDYEFPAVGHGKSDTRDDMAGNNDFLNVGHGMQKGGGEPEKSAGCAVGEEDRKQGSCPYVEFENVSFSYDGGREVLKDINIHLPLDKKIAIVGENGSGKSTFVKLLLGLYAPSGGKITYYSPDMAVKNSQGLFCTMLQDYRIFPLSIRDNVCPDVRDFCRGTKEDNTAQVMEALCFAGLEEKVAALPNGIHTVLTGEFLEEGVSLSGGEQQKLAIARAYAKTAPVLVLDEPSAKLDPISEHAIIQKISRLAGGRGVVLVTHDPVYAKYVDMVVFFEGGRIVKAGPPGELMQQCGRYKEMWGEG